ncbi:hypothetical protein PLESTB_001714500 [Pleodorina starrii]|uniref:Rhodanese domain-containing protein n=1 Tax=Pleodorina starrii TaxID=330485 RepID=A0A9W6BZR1_9CHLO|nr:hypothetical protein PLESTM_000790500 [Pleodorina starrii]GLC61083.1 hypothetical protein PLESTB_001714500 [Pleodorina starrii]GLC75882.1 hypothetical protein PLESTF_001700000 [Pleodorina starrii]
MIAKTVRSTPALRAVFKSITLLSTSQGSCAIARNFSSSVALPEIDSDELVKQLDAKAPGLLVLDVRSPEELAAGSIRGSLNLPTPLFKQADTAPLDRAIREHIGSAQEVVVHCLFCSPGKRGPTAAAALQQRLQALAVSPAPRVSVLRGGIDAFMAKYGSRTDLVTLPPGGWKAQTH